MCSAKSNAKKEQINVQLIKHDEDEEEEDSCASRGEDCDNDKEDL